MKRIVLLSCLLLSWTVGGDLGAQPPAPQPPVPQPPPTQPPPPDPKPAADPLAPAADPLAPAADPLAPAADPLKAAADPRAAAAVVDPLFQDELAQEQEDLKKTYKIKTVDDKTGPARPQLLSIRGGSLGFPSPANSTGLLAGVDAKIVGGENLSTTSSADVFAKVGGLSIGNRVMAEVIGESFEADIPVITLTGMPAVPVMTKTSFSSVGIRGRYNFGQAWKPQPLDDECAEDGARLSLAEKLLDEEASADARKKQRALKNAGAAALATDPACRHLIETISRERIFSLTGGVRVVRRGGSNEGLTNLGGVQWEFGLRHDAEAHVDDWLSWSFTFGLAGMHLNQADVEVDGVTTRYIRMNDLRATFSLEVRKPAKDEAVTSALGVYGALSQDYWTNKFHVGGADKVRDLQLEGGVYISGVMKGFSGLIMLSIIKPYAPGAENLYAVSVLPFGGGTPGKESN